MGDARMWLHPIHSAHPAYVPQSAFIRLGLEGEALLTVALSADGNHRPPADEVVLCTLDEGSPFITIGDGNNRVDVPVKLAELSYAPDNNSGVAIVALVLPPVDPEATERAAWCLVASDPDALLCFLENAGRLGAIRNDLHDFYELEREPLSFGGHSTVHGARRCYDLPTTVEVAVKAVSPATSDKDKVFEEVQNLLAVGSHPNVVAFRGLFHLGSTSYAAAPSDGPEWALVMDRYAMDLHDLVHASGLIPERQMSTILRGVLSALVHIHAAGLAHRDVKAENVLLNGDQLENAVICDFGVAARVDDAAAMGRRAGSPGYIAPEVLEGRSYGTKVDLFGAGCLLHLGLTGSLPFGGNGDGKVVERTVRARLDPAKLHHSSSDARRLVRRLLRSDPKRRPSGTAALQYPWVQARAAFPPPPRGSGDEAGLRKRLVRQQWAERMAKRGEAVSRRTFHEQSARAGRTV